MASSVSDLAFICAAVVLAAIGGELFLKGVLGIAQALRVPKLLVATTLAAFATSAPELTVSSIAAIAGKPELGLGDALGSNVVNIALIFGLALMFGPIHIARQELGRDFALALTTPLITLWFAANGTLSSNEGGALLVIFALWAIIVLRAGWKHRRTSVAEAPTMHAGMTVAYTASGLVALVVAGRFFVTGATGVATDMGVDAYVIGAIVVAVGTSLPELVTVVFARLRGHDEVGVGTLIGSNLFNGLAIVGLAASIHPVRVPFDAIFVALALGIVSLLMLIPGRSELIGRTRGVMLLVVYSVFIVATATVAR